MKIEEQVLSREQMAHLQELGVDTSDASMYWSYENSCGDRYWVLLPYDKDYGYDKETIPTYTTGDLIRKIPSSLKSEWFFSHLNICTDGSDEPYYSVSYDVEYNNIEGEQTGERLEDVLYQFLCWVAENHKELIK